MSIGKINNFFNFIYLQQQPQKIASLVINLDKKIIVKKIPFVIMSLLLTLCGGDDLPESTTVISDQECLSASEIKEIELSISESEISLGEDITQPENGETIEIGKSKTILHSDQNDVIILSFGNLLGSAVEVGKKLNCRVVDMRFIKPIDEKLLQEISGNYQLIVTLEDNVIAGGAGSAVNETLLALNSTSKILNLGLPDEFIEHGDQDQQKTLNGLDENGVEKSILEKLKSI